MRDVEEDDSSLTKRQLELISALGDSQVDEIDQAIINAASSQWRKVARVVATAMMSLDNRILGIPDIYYAQRVALLISSGHLVAQGNIERMRYCEVRLP